MELIEFLNSENCPVKHKVIADKLFEGKKTPTTTFSNKLKGVQDRKFSAEEKKRILEILQDLCIEIKNVTID